LVSVKVNRFAGTSVNITQGQPDSLRQVVQKQIEVSEGGSEEV
jgi:hypothetical protein